ncbi:MAG: hypothetical protein DRR15_18615, partial [Gammaproteobacteria bacterium]
AIIATVLPHLLVLVIRMARRTAQAQASAYLGWTLAMTMVGIILIAGAAHLWAPPPYANEFPDDYTFPYGEDRPFAPSLAKTDTGGPFDPRSLAGSSSCGTGGCHEQILAEWTPSAHRYAAKDPLFMGIQAVMAKQNGPESTRYCGGCHDPISLFSGAKNIFTENLTGPQGYDEGISCLVCHAVRETDLQGNANYVMTQPSEYLWQWETEGAARVARDFLIRTYPAEHQTLSKQMFKAPEYCAACHKQFIDEEVNQVGWVQLQNQYDNWAASQWHVKDDPTRTIECRECHMPLIDSNDPAAGDSADYNRSPDDGKHRSHRFIAANALVPELLKLDGWEEHVRLTQEWLAGERKIPEIADKWAEGPIVGLQIAVPDTITAGEELPLQIVFTSNKVGHDFPTGPLDIIQSWLQLEIKDDAGNVLYTMGTRDEAHFIEPGTFMFKAEPIDQYGNTIDRHNLWEMVGVRFRRALFPGYSDAVDFSIDCSAALSQQGDVAKSSAFNESVELNSSQDPGHYHITASLQYRKVDQFLLNYMLGEDSGVFAPVMELTRTTATVKVTSR